MLVYLGIDLRLLNFLRLHVYVEPTDLPELLSSENFPKTLYYFLFIYTYIYIYIYMEKSATNKNNDPSDPKSISKG